MGESGPCWLISCCALSHCNRRKSAASRNSSISSAGIASGNTGPAASLDAADEHDEGGLMPGVRLLLPGMLPYLCHCVLYLGRDQATRGAERDVARRGGARVRLHRTQGLTATAPLCHRGL